ncbi:MAG: nucleoside-diphosphate-sugar epimerase [Bacteriovoracaceae bacterium]|jgi:nucleoside-diphosphate-sugar epimerase
MKILITGGAGYIGSRLVPFLLDLNYQIIVLDNFYYNQTSLLPVCTNENLEIINGDVRDEATLKRALVGVDLIIPLACLTGAPACKANPDYATSTNLEAIRLLLQLRRNDQKIIYPNTNSGYGIGTKEELCNEKSPLNPVSLYGILKNQAEKLILESGNSVAFRFATVFGVSNRMRTDLLVNDFVYKAITHKEITLFESHYRRNFLYIGDAVKAFHFTIINFDKMINNTFNIGLSSANLTKMELCKVIKSEIPSLLIKEEEFSTDPDKRDYLVSNDKIRKIGFEAKVSIQKGILELKKSYVFINPENHRNI